MVVYGIVRKPFIASFFIIAILAAGSIMTLGQSPIAITGTALTALLIIANPKSNIAELFHQCPTEELR